MLLDEPLHEAQPRFRDSGGPAISYDRPQTARSLAIWSHLVNHCTLAKATSCMGFQVTSSTAFSTCLARPDDRCLGQTLNGWCRANGHQKSENGSVANTKNETALVRRKMVSRDREHQLHCAEEAWLQETSSSAQRRSFCTSCISSSLPASLSLPPSNLESHICTAQKASRRV